jgi:hypothetical protein
MKLSPCSTAAFIRLGGEFLFLEIYDADLREPLSDGDFYDDGVHDDGVHDHFSDEGFSDFDDYSD